MSQTSNTSRETQADIVKRLETLNRWQEEQKKLLQERQNVQRRQLGLEQRNMYQMLGLLHSAKVVTDAEEASFVGEREVAEISVGDEPQHDKTEENLSEVNQHEQEDEETHKTTSGYYTTSTAAEEAQILASEETTEPKRPFLRRGAGLKQRFKVDPETLRLNNLPRYKYVNAHPQLRASSTKLQKRRNSAPPPAGVPKPAAKSKAAAKDEPLDAMEKRFQELLFSSKTACNSTPDTKLLSSASCSSGGVTSSSAVLAKVQHFVELTSQQEQDVNISTASELPQIAANRISWSKVLDSQQLRPLQVHEMRSKAILRRGGEQTDTEEENLSIFELLEQKANDGTIDMNSSCIKRFMINNLQRRPHNGDGDSMDIPVDNRLKETVLQPMVNEVLDTDDASDTDSNEENDEDFKECDGTSAPAYPVRTARVHVRFSEENDTREYVNEDNVSESSTLEAEETNADETEASSATTDPLERSDDLFHQFKEILFSALQSRVAEDKGNAAESNLLVPSVAFSKPTTISMSPPQPSSLIKPTLFTEDLQAQSNLIKRRLEELEKEIGIFKENNMELIKAKQAHELERTQLATEHQEACDRLKDEKIQIEIYLHDERMKFEEERAKLAEQMRRAKVNSKERKEITRLKQELDAAQLQLKEKEHNHAAAQARLRTQIRNLERDQKAIYDDIERLNKENKRLQNENVKIGRENNNKMLQEINRNIAKLAPKLTTVTNAADEDFTPRPKLPFMSVVKGHITKKNPVHKQSPTATANSALLTARHSKLSKKNINRDENTSDSELEEPRSSKYFSEHAASDDVEDDDIEDVNKVTAKELQAVANNNNNQKTSARQIVATKSESSLTTNTESSSSNSAITTTVPTTEFKREIVNADGSKDIWYPNGNLKKISADGMLIRMLYFNKDIKETSINEGTVKYYYAETNTWHTTYLDGLEILEFPNGQTEHRHKSGLVEVHFPNNSIKVTNPADSAVQEEWRFADGTNLTQMRNGDKIIKMTNGQKEIHTKLNKRREYPDGTVKLVYPDGSQETRYSNGRLRLKDKDGKLVMDTDTASY